MALEPTDPLNCTCRADAALSWRLHAIAGRQEPYVYGSLPDGEQFYLVAGT